MNALENYRIEFEENENLDLIQIEFAKERKEAAQKVSEAIDNFKEVLGKDLIADAICLLEMKLMKLKDEQTEFRNNKNANRPSSH